ncbi:MAG: carboxypeptidase regulatory-like domain-containing protein, partial [Opitutaceae bacterium]|nr:carboxypeptidase regulatory-like domain-containing protein [Opitutaceae bacterium]
MRSVTHAARLFLALAFVLLAPALTRAQSLTVSGTTTLPADTVATYTSITVQSGGVLDIGGGSAITITGALTVEAGGTVLCRSKNISAQVDGAWVGAGVTLHAGSVSVAATGSISADGQGYANGIGPGFPTGLAATTAYRTGASHGGTGTGTGFVRAYGNGYEPTTPGQGAAFYDNEQTAGGGAIRLIVDGTLTLDGEISADGSGTPAASQVFHGGATGGSIWVTAGTLTGAGRFTADALSAAYNTSVTSYGQSGGGRIAVYAGSDAGFTGWTPTTVNSGGGAAQAGTLVIAIGAPGTQAMRIPARVDFPQDIQLALQSLTLDNNATLSLGGGTALSIAGALTLGDAATLLCQGKNVAAQVDGAWAGAGVSIQAASVVVPATAKISADGQGYVDGAGPGFATGSTYATGAAYGGMASGAGAMAAYGSSLRPIDLGSSGEAGSNVTTAGGGAIKLTVTGSLILEGSITANGTGTGPGTGRSHGGATGGSLWITAHTLTGSGTITANAMPSVFINNVPSNGGQSSGGRIALYYQDGTGFTGLSAMRVDAGSTTAQPGTLVVLDTSVPGGGAMYVTQRMTLDEGPIYSLGALTIENGATVEVAGGVALDIDGPLTLTGSSTLQLRSLNHLGQIDGGWLGTGATIVAGDVNVAAGSRISVDGEGYRNGNGPGFPIGLPVATDQDTGASYGGRGTGTGALLPYGDPLAPVSLGTGAAIADNEMTAGGGALRLIVHGTLVLNGEISADGIATNPGFQVNHGGASGGSLWVTTNTLTGSGRFSAEGFPGVFINGYKTNGSSSGGRAAIYYRSAGGFTGFADSSAGAPNSNADPGTMLFIQDDGGQLSVRAFERVDVLSDRILDVHALTLEAGARLDLYGGSTLRVAGMLDLRDDVLVNFWSRNRDASFADAWIGEGARIDAGDMRVAPTAILTADAQGYRDGMGPGGPNAGDGSNGIGGSYGGKGSGAAAKEPYGSLVAPRDLGSAGGYNRNNAHPNTSTTAGGAIFLNVAGSLEFHGIATATGAVRDTTHAGATGGSILMRADRLSGTGRLIADAISGSGNNQSSGGRIAIWATTNTLPTSSASARSGGPTAQPGTIHYADGNAIAWIRSPLEVFTGPTRLDWLATGSATTTGIDILAQPAAGPALTLATGLAPTASLLWDTTTLEDGLYTLTARKRDTHTGEILGTDTRTVTLLNNALVLRGTITQSVTIPAGKVSFIVGPIVIPAGVTVTAEPGAIIKISLGASVIVEAGGTLSALGTAEAPIVFTSILDDTIGGDSNFDGTATAPGVVDWNGLRSNGGAIAFNEFAEVRHAVEMVDNNITTTVRWRAGSVRVITRTIDIIQGGALTIEPGAIVKFARNTGIRVAAGTLAVEGTLLRPVIFTSDRDDSVGGDSNGDGSLTTPIPGDYYGLQFEDTVSTLRHAEFRYGAESWAGFRGLLDIRTADVLFESCTFVDILFEAAYLQPDHGGTATFENCIFTRVDRPIFANRGSVAVVRNCVFDGNRRAIHISGGRVDVYNSAITNSLNWGVIVDDGSAITDFLNNAFWNPRATGGNVTGATIALGTNGVIEGDPRFVDRGALDYRVLAGSALIDAGNAAQDVPADFRGFARLGTAPEIGAYEFTAPHASPIDLSAEISGPPASALSGSAIDLTVVARNAGTAPVTAPWRHAIFLRPMDGGVDVPVAEFVDQPAASLAAGAAASFTTRVTVPDGLVGLYSFGITVNPREEAFEGIHLANNTSVAGAPTTMDVPELPFGGSVSGRFFRAGESRVVKVRPATPGQTIHLLGDTEATRGFTRVLAARGRVPTEDDFDTQSPQWDQPNATLAIANSADDWYYVRIVASELRVPTTAFTLAARAVEFQLSGLGVTTVGTGPVTVGVLGTDLRQGATVTLRPVGGASAVNARDVVVTGGTSADATFDLTGAAPGLYDVVVTQGGLERVLPGSLRVSSAATGANIITTVAGPGVNRVGFPYFAAVTARNTGAADSPAPIITVSGPGMPVDLNDPESPFYGYGYAEDDTGRDFFLAIPPTGNPAVLPASRSAEVFIAQGITPDGRFEVATNIVQAGDTTPYDLVGFGTHLAPNPKPAGWDDAWALLATSEPQTLGGLAHLTATAADALYRQSGYRSNDVAAILARHVDAVRIAMLNRIHGRVQWLDAAEHAPLGGIQVSLVDFDGTPAGRATTLADGTFSFPAIPSGVYDWELEGAFPAAAFAPLEVTFGTTIEGIALTMVPGASAHARILPVAGVPFETMLVTLHNLELGINASAVPDALGQVTLRGLPEATFTLTALAPGRTTVTRPGVNVVLGASNDLGQIQFASTTGSLAGAVARQDTQAPIAGAAVFVAGVPGAFARTDEAGAYRIETVPTGTQTLRVVAPGFATALATDVVIVGGAETTRNVSLAPGATVTGVVTVGGGAGEGGTAVAGATVELTDGTQVLMSAQSDATGRYTLSDLPAGAFTLQAFNDLRGAASAPVDVVLATQTVANLELVPTKTISGAVRYTGGTLAGQIGMRVQGVVGTPEFTVTNSDGRFVLNGLPAGDYVWSLADGGRRTPLTISADGTTATSLDLSLDAGEIAGRVFAADGTTPLATMVQLVRDGKVVSSTASNAAGEYRFALVAPGTYEVHAIGLEQYFTPVTGVVVTAGSGTTPAPLIGGFATLDLTVRLGSSGAPPSGFAIAFLDPVGGPHGTTTQLLGRLDASGATRFTSLAPGAYRVHAIGIGVASEQTIIEVAVGANQASLTLEPSGYVGGRITAPGGLGVEGLDVIVHRAGDIQRQWTGQTNRDGDYAIGGLLPGDYVIQVADRRTEPDTAPLLMPAGQALSIAAGDDLVRNIALLASAQKISGRLVATDGSFPFRADISLRNAAGIEVLRRRLDGTGAFALPLPAAGDYTLTASALGFLASDQAITVGTTAITTDLAATWTGGAAQLSLGSSAFATHDGPPLQALSVSSLFGWVGECKDAFRELLEDVLQKPEPPQPDFFAPDFLKDPCLSCPAAKAAWDRTARLQMIANNQYSAWHDAWQAQVEQISAEVGLLGVNLLKLAGAMAQAELEMLDIAKTVAEEIPKMGALLASIAKSSTQEPYLEWAIERHDELWKLQDGLNAVFYTGIAGGVAGQLDPSNGKGPKFMESLSNLFKPSTYQSWDSIYGACSDITGIVKAITDLGQLSGNFRTAFEGTPFDKVLKALDKFFTLMDPLVQSFKTVQTALNTSMAVQNSKDLYYRAINARNEAYAECMSAMDDCVCVGGEECGCEDPPPPCLLYTSDAADD